MIDRVALAEELYAKERGRTSLAVSKQDIIAAINSTYSLQYTKTFQQSKTGERTEQYIIPSTKLFIEFLGNETSPRAVTVWFPAEEPAVTHAGTVLGALSKLFPNTRIPPDVGLDQAMRALDAGHAARVAVDLDNATSIEVQRDETPKGDMYHVSFVAL